MEAPGVLISAFWVTSLQTSTTCKGVILVPVEQMRKLKAQGGERSHRAFGEEVV